MAVVIPKEQRDFMPKWTARVVEEFGGRDPLGLSSVSQLLTSQLLSGIITTTKWARYYSIYCWILWHIGENDSPEDVDEYMRAFQRCEAAFAVGTVLDESFDKDPLGVTVVEKRLDGDPEELSLQFRVLPSNPFGGFGANYVGCMYDLGLWHRPTEVREEVTAGTATELALAVESALTGTPYSSKRLWRDESVALEDLRQSASALSLGAVMQDVGTRERRLIADLLMGFDEVPESEPRALRRQSLTFILWLVSEYERAGLECPAGDVAAHLLYWPSYYGALSAHDGDRWVPSSVPEQLVAAVTAWRQFCAHGYLTFAIEQVMASVLSTLERHPEGLTAADVVYYLLADGFGETLESATRARCDTPYGLSEVLALEAERSEIHDELSPPVGDELSEHALAGRVSKTAGERLANGILLLAVLYKRWRSTPDDRAMRLLRVQAAKELWLGSVLPALDEWFAPGAVWAEVVLEFINRFVVERHDIVMYSKGRLESCWLHADGQRLHFDQDLTPHVRGSRIPQAVEMLLDIMLLEKIEVGGNRKLRITEAGRSTLSRALEQGA